MENTKDDLIEVTYIDEGVLFSTIHGVKVKFTNGRVKVDVAESYTGLVNLTFFCYVQLMMFSRTRGVSNIY